MGSSMGLMFGFVWHNFVTEMSEIKLNDFWFKAGETRT